MELVRSTGVDVESAQDLIQEFEGLVSVEMIKSTGVDYVIKDRQIVITTDEMIKPFNSAGKVQHPANAFNWKLYAFSLKIYSNETKKKSN